MPEEMGTLGSEQAPSVLDEARAGEIRGALGTIGEHDLAPRRSLRAKLLTLAAVVGPGVIVMILLAYTIFTTTLVLQRKQAARGLAVSRAETSVAAQAPVFQQDREHGRMRGHRPPPYRCDTPAGKASRPLRR